MKSKGKRPLTIFEILCSLFNELQNEQKNFGTKFAVN